MADAWRLTTPDLLGELATLAFLNGGDEGKKLYNSFLIGRTTYEVYNRLKSQQVNEADVLRAQTIASIADYVKKHPNASQSQLKNELTKQITAFAQKVAALERYK